MSDYKLSNNLSFADAISAICTFVFAYAGTPLFFPIAAEMRDPRQYTKALVLCQSTVTATYIIIGIMVYYYCGSYVASPALGSAGPVIKKIAYGLALPGLLAGATINAHVSKQESTCKGEIAKSHRPQASTRLSASSAARGI